MNQKPTRSAYISRTVVTTAQMQAIEARIFAAGMPVAALMEKVAGRIAQQISAMYLPTTHPRVTVLVGPGHNGGDALVVARELHFCGYDVQVCMPFDRAKELTQQHLAYVRSLGIPVRSTLTELADCNFWVDGLFGFGLSRLTQWQCGDDRRTGQYWWLTDRQY